MKTQKLILALLAVSLLTLSFQSTRTGNLKVSVTGIRNSNGEINLNLYTGEDGFPKEEAKAIRHLRGKISNGTSIVTFENLAYGTYAIATYHDENNDHALSKTWYGRPTEGVAVSNNAKGSISGPPSFDAAKFDFTPQTNMVSITMDYTYAAK